MEEKSITDISSQLQTQDLNLDTSVNNVVLIVQGRIALEAVEDKIIVQLDPFKSGYECQACGGSGLELPCNACENGLNRFGTACKICDGNPTKYAGQECRACKGKGTSIIIPESAKALPTSGRIVSTGPKCMLRQLGERVLFGAHVGYFLPFKGNILLRCMREHEVMCLIHGIERDVALGDFLVLESDGDYRS